MGEKKDVGVKLGRPIGRSKDWYRFQEKYPYIIKKRADGVSLSVLAKQLKIHRNTLARYLKEQEV